MDRVGTGHAGDADDFGDAEIGRNRAEPLTDPIGLIRLEAVEGKLVLFGIDGDGFLAKLVGGTHDADGDLATVGDQDFAEVGHSEVPLGIGGQDADTLGVLQCSARGRSDAV
ncbi:hypothetical protein GALL_535320 [mine drainage metagenome]|uniref:Uncharacterized protein n=1 Tax=mine drainage metagenome TaxID=410659 RepID=A0A1J5PI11_9ZZZZ